MKTIMSAAVLALSSFGSVAFAAEHPGAAPAATAAASSAAVETTAPAASLDGKAFVGTISKDGEKKKKGDKDELVFADGTFRSTACDKYGFTATTYTAHEEAGKTTFEAVATNKDGEKMEWKGTIAAEKAAASATYVNAKGKTEKYGFKGDAKK